MHSYQLLDTRAGALAPPVAVHVGAGCRVDPNTRAEITLADRQGVVALHPARLDARAAQGDGAAAGADCRASVIRKDIAFEISRGIRQANGITRHMVELVVSDLIARTAVGTVNRIPPDSAKANVLDAHGIPTRDDCITGDVVHRTARKLQGSALHRQAVVVGNGCVCHGRGALNRDAFPVASTHWTFPRGVLLNKRRAEP